MAKHNLNLYLKENQDNLIIFGAGYLGARIAKTCKLNNISPKYFCDNNISDPKKYIDNISICSFDEIMEIYKDKIPVFLISPQEKKYQDEIISQLKSAGFSSLNYYDASYFFSNIEEVYLESLSEKIDLMEHKMQCYKTTDTDYMYIPDLIIDITYLCTLNCEHCSHFVPYHKNPKHFKKEDIFSYLDRIDEIFDNIGKLGLLGGEPLLHPDLFEIIEYAQSKKSIQSIRINTNGTIVPDKEKFNNLNYDKVQFMLSDYEELSINLDNLKQRLDEVGIEWEIYEPSRWLPVTDIRFRNKTIKEMEESYAACCAERCLYTHIMNGYLLPCVMANAGGYVAKGLPEDTLQKIDFMTSSKTISELRSEIRKFKYDITYYEACNWCPVCKDVETIYVEPALQVQGKLNLAKTYNN